MSEQRQRRAIIRPIHCGRQTTATMGRGPGTVPGACLSARPQPSPKQTTGTKHLLCGLLTGSRVVCAEFSCCRFIELRGLCCAVVSARCKADTAFVARRSEDIAPAADLMVFLKALSGGWTRRRPGGTFCDRRLSPLLVCIAKLRPRAACRPHQAAGRLLERRWQCFDSGLGSMRRAARVEKGAVGCRCCIYAAAAAARLISPSRPHADAQRRLTDLARRRGLLPGDGAGGVHGGRARVTRWAQRSLRMSLEFL